MMMIHRVVLDAVGAFDPTVPRAEDRDICIRIALAGYPIALVPEPLVLYRVREKPDGEMIYATFCTTMTVLERHLIERRDRNAQNALARQARRTLRRIRGWYANEMLAAARQEPDRARSRRFARLAFGISPLHWVRHAGWSR
jgi:GT2 family glycosyltransferase